MFSCTQVRPKEALLELKDDTVILKKINHADSLFAIKENIKMYAKAKNSSSLFEVSSTGAWPDSLDVVYNVCFDKANSVILFKELPIVESGDINLRYSYYLNEDSVYAIKTMVSFFDEDCSEMAIEEITTYFLVNGSIVNKIYSIKDRSGTKLDSLNCSFGELMRFTKYKTLSESPISQINK
jgi:hypothetical protein